MCTGNLYFVDIPDEDECAINSNDCSCASGLLACSAVCLNKEGSFDCGCSSGYRLDTDGKTCIGMVDSK